MPEGRNELANSIDALPSTSYYLKRSVWPFKPLTGAHSVWHWHTGTDCHIPHQNHTPFVERKINPVNFFRMQGMI